MRKYLYMTSCLICFTAAFSFQIQTSVTCKSNRVRRGRCMGMAAEPSTPVPRDIKDVLQAMRASVQAAIGNRVSRMDVELPTGLRFGVEKLPAGTDAEKITQSDRELARLFVEMFDPLGETMMVAFRTEEDARAARDSWASGPYKGKVTSIATRVAAASASSSPIPKKGKGKSAGGGGFGKKSLVVEAPVATSTRNGLVPPGIELFICVAPKEKELMALQVELDDLGMDCLVILLNARLDAIATSGAASQLSKLLEAFDGVFHLRPLSSSGGSGGADDLLHRAYPRGWTIARKPAVGAPKVLKVFDDRPKAPAVKAALAEAPSGIFGNIF